MSTEEVQDKRDNAKLLLQAMMTLFLACIVAMNGWALNKIVSLDRDTAVNTKWIEAFSGEGPRFTANDFAREQSITLRLIDDLDSDLDDLRVRVRDLERNNK